MIYKLTILDSNKRELGKYSGKNIESEELFENCLIIRLPFDFTDEELDNTTSLFRKQLTEFILSLKSNDKLKDKMVYVVPKSVCFMKLEKVEE